MKERTTQVLNSNLELLPIPNMFVPRHLLHDSTEFVKPLAGLRTQVMPSDLVPVLLRDFALDAPSFYGGEPGDGVFILLAIEDGRVLPRDVYWFEIERLDFEGIEHRGSKPDAFERRAAGV